MASVTVNPSISFFLWLFLMFSSVLVQASQQDFTWSQRTIVDADKNEVVVFVCEGLKKHLEAVVFSMNVYGDGTLTGYESLKEFGYGRITGSQIALSAVPAWARSVFSSDAGEQKQNQGFRQFLIKRGILTRKNQLTPAYARTPASILFYFLDMKRGAEEVEIHENSHVFYNCAPL